MAVFQAVVHSTWPVGQVFAYLADFSHAAEWDPGVATAARLDEGAIGLGSSFRLGVLIGGRVTDIEYAIVAYEPGESVRFLGQTRWIRSEDTVTVAPQRAASDPGSSSDGTGGHGPTSNAEGGSLLSYHAELRLTGAMVPANLLLGRPFRRIGDRGIAGLSEVLSATPRPPGARSTVGG